MSKILQVLQIFSAFIIIVSVLLQQKGTGLSEVFGGENTSYRTKRGAEKFLLWITIVMSLVFFGSTLASYIISAR